LKQGFQGDTTANIAVAAKTYEYLATGLPILADCPEGDNAEMVRQYCAYPYVVTSQNREDLKAAVLNAYAAAATMVPRVTPEFEKRFNRRALTGRLAAVLDGVTRRSA